MGLKLLRVGQALPDKVYDNFYFESFLDTSDEWIQQRTGIKQRHIAEEEDVIDLSVRAALDLFKDLEEEVKDSIDLVIEATFTTEAMFPNTAAYVHHALDLKENCFVFDINIACAGFTGALKLADSLLETGKRAIILGAEVLSKILDFTDRSTCILFGDGAGAVLVEKTANNLSFDVGCLEDEDLSLHMIAENNVKKEESVFKMGGKDVYRFSTSSVPASIQRSLDDQGIGADDIDYYVLHQANARILKIIARKLDVSEDKFINNIDEVANTSAASIPLALYKMQDEGLLKEGQKLLLSAFGGGLHYSSLIIEVGETYL